MTVRVDRCAAVNPETDGQCVFAPGHEGDVHVRGLERWKNAPTKQREGDQRLPDGGQECVQDLVIEAMEESKRVGAERYGTPLMTFNGRKGFQDVLEEARDLFVYLTQVGREAEAARSTLVDVVAQEIRAKDGDHSMGAGALAEVVVDRIMGWVFGQQMGQADE